MPAVKQRLTDATMLYHIVQLLVTYEPSIVQRVATLLLLIMQDNPFLPRLYLSGVFYFILMYNGSNVLPIARFLHYTHLKQAFRSAMVFSFLFFLTKLLLSSTRLDSLSWLQFCQRRPPSIWNSTGRKNTRKFFSASLTTRRLFGIPRCARISSRRLLFMWRISRADSLPMSRLSINSVRSL